MKQFLFIKHLSVCFCFTALMLCSCNKEEDFDEIYGSGCPLAENIIPLAGYQYEHNEKGLVTKILRIDKKQDDNGTTKTKLVTVATISYPQDNRAVMVCSGFFGTATYTFAFGENHFANRVIETDGEGESGMIKYHYDSDGHVTYIDDWGEDFLEMEWTNGNLTKIKQDEGDATAVLTYGDMTNFTTYNMSPFLLDVNLESMYSLEWWYNDLKYALYIGFLGRPCRNLPETIAFFNKDNKTPEHRYFHYTDYNGYGSWSLGTEP